MRVVMIAIGSAGDVHPHVAVGRALRSRGHEVFLFASRRFERLAEENGLRFAGGPGEELYGPLAAHPDLWSPRRGIALLMRGAVLPALEENLEALLRLTQEAPSVIVASTLDLGGRIVRELHGTPLATVHPSPAALRTCHRTPVFRRRPRLGKPRWMKRAAWWLVDRFLDPRFVPELNEVRAGLGLPPLKRPLHRWRNSPDRVLGLFPDWFGPIQPDWPPQLRLTGFPFFDRGGGLDPGLKGWLDREGEPPLVFVAGSAMPRETPFYAVSVEACRILGRRGVLIGPLRDSLPDPLPATVRHAAYVPLSKLLPRAAAVVSHGGVGTLAHGLAAGIPQVAAPTAFDQFDNASRLEDLGVGRSLPMRRLPAPRVAAILEDLMGSPRVARRCEEIAALLRGEDGATRACEEIEALGAGAPAPTRP